MLRSRLLLLVIAASVAIAACSSDNSTDGVASLENTGSPTTRQAVETSVDEDVDFEQAMLDFTQCLRDEGIDIDDPEIDADGRFGFRAMTESAGDVDREELREAFETCQSELEGITLRGAGIDRTAIQDTLIEYAACMRDNGYDMEDPDLSTFGPGNGDGEGQPGQGGGPFGDIDPEDPDFIAANEACQSVFVTGLPRFLGGEGGGTGGGE
jgi:hypothetical protein